MNVELKMPDRVENTPLFMLHTDLLNASGTALQQSHRALMMHTRSFIVSTIRHLVLLPLYLTGLKSEMETVRGHRLARHRERRDSPLAAVRVTLTAKGGDAPPPLVFSARVRVDVNKSARPHIVQCCLHTELWTCPSTRDIQAKLCFNCLSRAPDVVVEQVSDELARLQRGAMRSWPCSASTQYSTAR